jgi:hypothetical protein
MMSFDVLNRLARGEGSTSIRQRNILTPLLWLDGTFSLGSLILATRVEGVIEWYLLVLGTLPPALTIFAYVWFMFREPDRLQSEEYQNTNRAMTLVSSQSGRAFSQADLKIVQNPASTPIPPSPVEDH